MDTSQAPVGGVVLQCLNLFCVVPCIVLKVPQIWTIFKNRSTKGVSTTSVLLEWFGYTVILMYQYANDYPIISYAEWIFINIQEFILVQMVLFYQNVSIARITLSGLLYFVFIGSVALESIPLWILAGLMSLVTPISASSKILQLQKIVSSRDSGQVSLITWMTALMTATGRIITTLIQTQDIP
ncbi:solute carrier family 66 member 3-like isoform X2 [Glandiceps talaboti]